MKKLRNIAIIAHVDHGKTTLVDHMLRQTGVFRSNEAVQDCVMDSNDLERERGITILAKNTSVTYKDTKINIIDTPGHHDFGGEVERVLAMADGALVLVDGADGPMPQTRYVLEKALSSGLELILVINKLDRPEARPAEVLDELQYLLLELDADDRQLHAPVIYAIGRTGKAKSDLESDWGDLTCLFDTILEHIPASKVDPEGSFCMGVSSLDYNDYVGRMAIGRVSAGNAETEKDVFLLKQDGKKIRGKIVKVEIFDKLGRQTVPMAEAGDICCIAGLPDCDLGDTIATSESAELVAFSPIDDPTISMNFLVNDSPLSGRDGEFLTANFLRDRLIRETLSDPALIVEPTGSPDSLRVKGRGLLHLSILIEKMRREGFELQLSRPEIIFREVNGVKMEPMERAEVTVDEAYLGRVMELLGTRRGEILNVEPRQNQMHIQVKIPTRALIGLHGRILSATRGTAVLSSALDGMAEFKGEIPDRLAGVIIQQEDGESATYALDNLKSRGTFFLPPGIPVYEGMIVGEHVHERDIVVNAGRKKKLTNMRSSTADAMIVLAQPKILSLEEALEYIKEDELVEVTPRVIRLRKKLLKEHQRKRAEQGQTARA